MGGKQSKPAAVPTPGTTSTTPTTASPPLMPTEKTPMLPPEPPKEDSQPITTVSPETKSKIENEDKQTEDTSSGSQDLDYTIMPVALEFPYNAFQKKTVTDFKKVEFMLFLGAECSRLAYSDVGILQLSMKALGLSPDILNKVITHYDKKYSSKKFSYTKKLNGASIPAPDSYDIQPCSIGPQPVPLMKYISSPTDTTCFVATAKLVQKNTYSILQDDDVIVTFKGSSSIRNWGKNLASLVTTNINKVLTKYNIPELPLFKEDFEVATSFLYPIMEIIKDIIKAIGEVSENKVKRIFVFGHSKGGAECELFGIVLSRFLAFQQQQPSFGEQSALDMPIPKPREGNVFEQKGGNITSELFKPLEKLQQIHMISYAAPKVVGIRSKESLNKQVFTDLGGNVTLTRTEVIGKIQGDIVAALAPGSTHPGWTMHGFGGLAIGNTLDKVREDYVGFTNPNKGSLLRTANTRIMETWPFDSNGNSTTEYPFLQTPVDLWDITNIRKLSKEVEKVTNESVTELERDAANASANRIEQLEAPTGGEKSNYMKIRGSKWAVAPHMEQFGMFFLGSQRIPGMKNPANTKDSAINTNFSKTFVAYIYKTCTRFEYVNWQAALAIPNSENTGGKKNRTKRKMKKLNKKATHKRQR